MIIFLPLLFFLFTSQCLAKVTGLLVWQEHEANLILPRLEDQEMRSIPQLYKTALEGSPHYKTLRPFFGKEGSIADSFQLGKVSVLPEFKTSKEPVPFVLFANSSSLINAKKHPFQNFKKTFGAAGATLFIIPFGIEALLPDKADLATYFNFISKQFPALVSAGGGDIDPSLYGEKNKFSIDPNLPLDQTEVQLIQSFVSSDKGVFYGVCRGHQAYAVAMGGTLIQDLPVLLSPTVIHRPTKNPDGSLSSSWHSITLNGKDNALFQAVEKTTFLVNSRHHQAVQALPPQKGEVIAMAGGNVIEAIEKKDTEGHLKVLTFQFHPEDMETPESQKIIKFMVDQARR